MNRIRLAVLIVAVLTSSMLSACSGRQAAASETPPPVPVPAARPESASAPAQASADVFRFRIGDLEAVALKDGELEVPNDGKTFGIGQPLAEVTGLLEAAGQPTDTLHLGIQPLLVRSGDRVLLFDTGAGDASFADGGHLATALGAAGTEPSQVTDIFISHRHADHVGGLLTGTGALAFPNAAIHLSAAEWLTLQGDADAAALVAAIKPKVATFDANAQIIPGVVTAVAVEGHTPGHSAYQISSGDEHLLYVGDAVHHHVVSVQRPEWTVVFDEDAPLAQASRRALMQRAAAGKLRIYAVHFPFPGLGRFEKKGESFVWVAER